MRLIDADEFKEIILTYGKAGYRALTIEKISELIDAQSTAYDVDKVGERLEEYLFEKYCVESDAKIDEIVKSGGIE